jgi:alpha-D-ribose 1-methylphosphonate 5-triphosphate synthase subunit PhnG
MISPESPGEPAIAGRQTWMSVLAKARPERLEELLTTEQRPGCEFLRKPETGLVMVRGRIGGTGGLFNLGEIPVTRCRIRLADGTTGDAYVMGRSARHAELAALCDALLKRPENAPHMMRNVIMPLAREEAERRRAAGLKSAATKVDFLTLVRGDD